MRKLIHIGVALVVLAGAHTTVRAQSMYQNLLATSAGRDSLLQLALWEDGRVTGNGRLFRYLESDNPLIRVRAAQVIGRIQDPQDVRRLLPHLKDSDARVVHETIFALGQIGSRDATPELVALGKKSTPEIQTLVLEALGKIGGPPAVEAIATSLQAFQSQVRRAGVLALARAADENAIPNLLIAVNDGDPEVAAWAIYALEKVESDRVAPAVRSFLESRDPRLRAAAARTLGRQKDEDSVADLIRCLSDTDDRVVINACDALGRILEDSREEKPVDALCKLTTEPASYHVRLSAIVALGKIGHKNAQNYLAQTMLDREIGIRAASCTAMAKSLEKNAVVFLGTSLEDGSRIVRAAAVEALGTTGDEKQIAVLKKFAQKDGDAMIRAAAVRGLGGFDKEKVTAILVEKLGDEDFVVATEAATALGKIEATDAVPALIERFTARQGRTDQDVRLAIMESLVGMKAAGGADIATASLESSDRRLRTLAAQLLDALEIPKPVIPSDREFYERDFDRARKGALVLPFGIKHAVIETKYGEIEIELYGDDAPQTAANFGRIAGAGKYDGLTFHRVVPDFVVQGGCPRGDGWGDMGYNIRSEFNEHHYERGAVGIAHAGKDTGGSQFFITHSPQPRLDGRYTVFGHVVKGMEVVDSIKQGDTFRARIVD